MTSSYICCMIREEIQTTQLVFGFRIKYNIKGKGISMSTRIQADIKSGMKLKEPKKYGVIMYNDDFTPMDFVVEILITVFHKNQEEAVTIMMAVHKGSKALVGAYSYDIACTKAERAVSMAREKGFPFRVTVEE